ncbi:MAG TPA: isocitrate/isopropylmalate family dehydrogenase, partial [Blastocatellia bacterium]|nr:isocitrate/isopropylmalate family dehydrogenase [Blastocatellia bacterium]
MKRIAVVPGDGIGPEVVNQAVETTKLAGELFGFELEFTWFNWGAENFLASGIALPEGALEMLSRDYDAILAGAFGDPRVPDNRHAKEILLGMRTGLDLYVNMRPIKLLHDRLCPLKGRGVADVDVVVFRENTEGPYVFMGGNFKEGTADELAIQEDINTYKGVRRIIEAAFEYARRNGRKRVTMSDKSNVLTYGHGLWQRLFKEVSLAYPEIESNHLY